MKPEDKAKVGKIMALAEAWRTAGGREEHAIREDHLRGAIEALLEQPVQADEPVTMVGALNEYSAMELVNRGFALTDPLYTRPPPDSWVGLTDEEMQALWGGYAHMELMRAIEAKLKEKNT
jgi:hypothetical protein